MSAISSNAESARSRTRPPSIRSHAKRPRTDDINSQDISNNKPRLRVTRACEECRKRKDRCDGRRPACEPCSRTGRTCSYNPSKKRGLLTGYVRAMEIVLGLVFSTVDGSEEWVSSLLEGEKTYPTFGLKESTSLHANHSADNLADSWRNSSLVNQIEKLLVQPESAEEDCEGSSTKVFDRRAALAIDIAGTIVHQKTPLANSGDICTQESPIHTVTTSTVVIDSPSSHTPHESSAISSRGTLSSLLDNQSPLQEPLTTFLSPNVGSQQEAENPSYSLHGLLPADWLALLDLYFATSHSWLPISPKHDLLRSSYVLASHTELNTLPQDLSQGDLSFLFAVLAYALFLREPISEERLNQDERIRMQDTQTSLKQRALRLLPADPNGFELGHVRALMVLTLLQIHLGSSKGAWLTLGRAVYALATLEVYPFREKGKNLGIQDGVKRTTLCCAVLDSMVASWLQVRPYFQHSDLATIGSISTDSVEEWEPWQYPGTTIGYSQSRAPPGMVLSCFNHLVQLSGLFNYLSSSSGERPEGNRLEVSKQMLHSFIQRLPSQNASVSTPDLLPQAKNLIILASIITEMIHAQELTIKGPQSALDYVSCHDHLKQAIEKLRHYTLNGATYLLSPLYEIYSSILHHILDVHSKTNPELPQVRGELQLMRNSLAELDRVRTTMKSNTHYPGACSAVPILSTQNEGVSMNGLQDAPSQPSPLLVFNSSGSFQPTQSHDYDMNFISSEQLNPTPQSSEQVIKWPLPHASGGRMLPISAQELEQSQDAMSSAPLLNHVPDETDDNGLFQSLADLDSADWPKESKAKREHLGLRTRQSS